MVAVAMLTGAVIVFVDLRHRDDALLEVGWVITAVANEARAAIRWGYPPAVAYVEADPPAAGPAPARRPPERAGHALLPGRARDGARGRSTLGWCAWRRRTTASSRSCHASVSTSSPADRCWPCTADRSPPAADLLACIDLGRARTLYQDPTFGLRQLVDVATQALSPAINQPTTAVLVIDRLHDLLLRIARLPTPTGLHVDATGTVRLVESTHSWDYLLHLAFVEVTTLGDLVAARRPGAWSPPSGICGPTCRATPLPELARLQSTLVELLRKHDTAGFAGLASTPDRLGLG